MRQRWMVMGCAALVGLLSAGCLTTRDDYDGDSKADFVYIDKNAAGFDSGNWYTATPTGPKLLYTASGNADIPAPGDYRNTGKADIVVIRPNGDWVFADGSLLSSFPAPDAWLAGYPVEPVPADYDGDSKDGSISTVMMPLQQMAVPAPYPGDYDGVGHAQRALFSVDGWHIDGRTAVDPFGGVNSVPPNNGLNWLAPDDYNGDGKVDPAYIDGSLQWRVEGMATTVSVPSDGSYGSLIPAAVGHNFVLNVARFTWVAKCQFSPYPPTNC